MAIQLANHFGCAILSADSRQFYREMKIGTAVPSEEELAAAPHYFIQYKSIYDNFTVGDFEKEAIAKLDELYKSSDVAIMVGGSGLYIDAVIKGLDDFPDVDPKVRQDLQSDFYTHGIEFLQSELQTSDPEYFKTVDTANPQRMMRALEVIRSSGKPYSAFLTRQKKHRKFIPIIIGLEADRAEMYDRINQRVDLMIEAGLLEEARKLYPNRNLNALQTVGYRELFSHFDGEFTLDFAISEIKKNTRRFAKRQMTWFKRSENAEWFDYKTDFEAVTKHIATIIAN